MGKPVVVSFIGDAARLTGTVTSVESRMGKLKGVIAGLGIGALLAGEFHRSIDAANESNEVSKQTEARLKSTGAQAWITAGQIGDLATALSNKTGIDDEQVQSNENLLLTFQSVRNEVGKGNDIFNQANKTILDMSIAFKQDGKSSAIQLGKALEDPVKGMTALSRIGITFTAQQKEQIKTLVESGHKLEAQKVILAAVNAQVAGSAEAAATPYKKLQVTLGNLEENLGNKLIPIINAASAFFNKHTGLVLGAAGALLALVGAIKAIEVAEKAWVIVQKALNLAMRMNPIGLVITAIALLVAGIIIAYKRSETFRNIVQGAFRGVQAAFNALWGTAQSVFNWIKDHWPLLVSILGGPIGAAVVLIIRNFDKIKNLAREMFQVGKRIVQGIIDGIKSMVGAVGNAISNVAQTVRNFLPFSPAKEGPLSGRGSPFLAGQNIARMIGQGIESGRGNARGAMGGLLSPVAAGAGRSSVVQHFHFNEHMDPVRVGREVAWAMKTSGR